MKVKLTHPLVSCICITKYRPDMLLKAIISFDQQNYPNRELVISYPEEDEKSREIISKVLKATDIRIIEITRDSNESIGIARNNAAAICTGDYVCLWDDDDQYFFSRIADQHNFLQGGGRYFQSSIITRVLLYDMIQRNAYVSSSYIWTGSLLCKKKHFLQYPCLDSNKNECLPVIEYLKSQKLLYQIDQSPSLYTYIYHGNNEISYINFKYFTRCGELIEQAFADDIRQELEQNIEIYIS